MRVRTGLLVSFAFASLLGCGGAEARRPNVIVIVLDTVRADRLSCTAPGRVATPNVEALCRRGIWFDHAFSTSSWTLPAHASLFTGLYPIEHGATQEHTRLEAAAPTLAEILRSRGYLTFGVSANPVVSAHSGLARGFDSFLETWRMPRNHPLPGARLHPNFRAVERLLAGVGPEQPFFLFVNYIEAHAPYTPPEPYRSRTLARRRGAASGSDPNALGVPEFYLDPSAVSPEQLAVLRGLYDGEIMYLDALLGGLIEGLEAGGHLDDTLLILTSDHGENIGDHGHLRHVFNLYGTAVRVPLLLLLPGGARAGEIVSESVSLVDVFATVVAATAPERLPVAGRGRDLRAPRHVGDDPPIFTEYYYPLQALGLFGKEPSQTQIELLAPYLRRLRSIEADGMRFIWSSDGRHELFDVTADPGERRSLLGDRSLAERERRLRDRLAVFVEQGGGDRPLPLVSADRAGAAGAFDGLDPESAELLRELGYLPR